MADKGTRFRVRKTPTLVPNVARKVGDIFLYDGNKWVPHPWGSAMSTVPNENWYSKIESCRDETHAGPPWSSGGPFTKITIKLPIFEIKGIGAHDSQGSLWPTGVGNYPVRYVGGFCNPQFVGDPIPTSKYLTPETLVSGNYLLPSLSVWSAQAYPRTAPALEKAGVAVAVAESRDLPRMMKQTSQAFHFAWDRLLSKPLPNWRQAPKAASDQFLNEQFGWVPFLADLRKFKNVYDNFHEYCGRIANDNNKWVKRKSTLLVGDPIYTRIDGGIGQRCEPLGGMFTSGTLFRAQPTWECGMITSTHVTTSGLFKYYRPEFDYHDPHYHGMFNMAMRAATLYGARVNPSNIYKATPWSWLADWFTNLGNIVDAASGWATDGIVAKYLYLMHHQMRTIRLTQVLPFKDGDVVLQWFRTCEVKRREEASSPYGFSLSGTALTLRQMAILAAIGIGGKFPQISP